MYNVRSQQWLGRWSLAAFACLLHCSLIQAAWAQPTDRLTSVIAGVENERKSLTDPKDNKRAARLLRLARELRRAQNPVTFDKIRCPKGGEFKYQRNVELTNDTIIECPKVTLEKGVTLSITDGRTLYLNVDEIVFGEGATIDGRGRKGDEGQAGNDVQPPWISQGDSDFAAALQGCRDSPTSTERGGAGGRGHDGWPGAIIIAKRTPVTTNGLPPPIFIEGGPGGSGGRGGNGRLLRNGRNFYCDGCTMNCPAGPAGQPGDKGDEGLRLFLD
jgi:hypothetical protein